MRRREESEVEEEAWFVLSRHAPRKVLQTAIEILSSERVRELLGKLTLDEFSVVNERLGTPTAARDFPEALIQATDELRAEIERPLSKEPEAGVWFVATTESLPPQVLESCELASTIEQLQRDLFGSFFELLESDQARADLIERFEAQTPDDVICWLRGCALEGWHVLRLQSLGSAEELV